MLRLFTFTRLKSEVRPENPIPGRNQIFVLPVQSVSRLAVLFVTMGIASCGGGGGGGGTVSTTPVAYPKSVQVNEDLSANMTVFADDPNNDPLIYSLVTLASKGTVTITDATTGALEYVPNTNETGSDSFTFHANDGTSSSNIATVTVDITPVNDPPVAAGRCGTTPQNVPFPFFEGTLRATDPDNAANTLSYSLNANGSGGAGPITTAKGATVTLNTSTGEFVYQPATGAGNKRGEDSFYYRVTDLDGAFSSAKETVIVDQKIMPLGDSITAGEEWLGSAYLADALRIGYRKELRDLLTTGGYNFDFVGSITTDGTDPSIAPFVDIQHEGHPGWTANDIYIGTYGWLDNKPADIILLHAGTNELATTDETHIEAILDEIDLWESNRGNPITVLLALIIDRDNKNDATVAAFNTAVNNMAQARIAGGDDIIIVNQQAAVDFNTEMSDALHPDPGGYIKMAGAWFTELDNSAVLDKCP